MQFCLIKTKPFFVPISNTPTGLVTYRESFVLVDPENTSLIRKQSIALTVGHEIAHQWFGNLVTMEWYVCAGPPQTFAVFPFYLACETRMFKIALLPLINDAQLGGRISG